jgi:hypothetical protein
MKADNFSTSLSPANGQQQRTTKLDYTIAQMDLIVIYKIFCPIDTELAFFSAAHQNFSKIIF